MYLFFSQFIFDDGSGVSGTLCLGMSGALHDASIYIYFFSFSLLIK